MSGYNTKEVRKLTHKVGQMIANNRHVVPEKNLQTVVNGVLKEVQQNRNFGQNKSSTILQTKENQNKSVRFYLK